MSAQHRAYASPRKESSLEFTRRNLLKAAAMLLMDGLASSRARALGINRLPDAPKDGPKVIVRTCGGIRAAETFHEDGFRNIPHLYGDLLPHTVFYPVVRNSGVISHYNTISCILIGNRQRVNDWGKTPPVSPTIFEYLRKRLQTPSDDAWLISSNTALTSQIAASSDRAYGPRYG